MLVMLFWLPGQLAADVLENITLTVNYDHPVPVNLKKFGVNGALVGADIGYGSNELAEIYKQIGIVFSRIPGGTIGNFYHWKTGRFSCDKTPDERAQTRIAQLNRSLERTKTTYAVDDFFEFMKNTGGDFTYVINTMCDSPQNNADLLSHMKNGNVNLNYVEMANETYSGSYAWAYANAQAYLDSARENYSAVKQHYPEAKVGVVVSPVSFSGKHIPDENWGPNSSWPERLRQFDMGGATAQFADALIIHVYCSPYDGRFWVSDPITNKEHYLRVIGPLNTKFGVSMAYLKFLGKGKPIWITEWGVTAPEEKRQGVFKEYLKSAYQALYLASGLASITLEEGVEIANYHNARDLWQSGTDQTVITPIGNILHLFIDAAKSTSTVYPMQAETDGAANDFAQLSQVKEFQSIEGASTVPVQAETDGSPKDVGLLSQVKGLKSLFFVSGKGGDLLLINEQDKAYVITRLNVGESKFNNFSVDALNIENDVFMTTKVEQKKFTEIGKARIEVKPFSIMRIRMN